MTADKFVVEFSGKSWRVFQFGEHIFSQSSFLGAQGSPLLEQVNHIIILLMEKNSNEFEEILNQIGFYNKY